MSETGALLGEHNQRDVDLVRLFNDLHHVWIPPTQVCVSVGVDGDSHLSPELRVDLMLKPDLFLDAGGLLGRH